MQKAKSYHSIFKISNQLNRHSISIIFLALNYLLFVPLCLRCVFLMPHVHSVLSVYLLSICAPVSCDLICLFVYSTFPPVCIVFPMSAAIVRAQLLDTYAKQ